MAEKTGHFSYNCDGNTGEAMQMESKAVFVGYNLPKWITKELLIRHFQSFLDKLDLLGRSAIIDAPGDRHGTVFFTDGCAVDQAIKQLNGTLLSWESRLDVNPSTSAKRSRLQSEVFSQEGGKRKKDAFAGGSRIGPQNRGSPPPFRPEGMPFSPISSPSSGSHLKYTALHPPPVPYTYPPGHSPSTISSYLLDAKEQSTCQNVQLEPLLWTLITSRHMSTLEAEDCKVLYSDKSPGVFEVSGKKVAVQSVVTKIKGIEADLKFKLCCETVEVDKSFHFSLNEQSILSFAKSVERECFVKIDLPRSNAVLRGSTGPTSNPQIILNGDKAGSSDDPDVVVYHWEFMNDDGEFKPFEQKLSSEVESKYLRDPKSHFDIHRGKWSYSVNLDTMTQMNKETRKKRRIKRYIPSWYWEDNDGTYQPYSQTVSVNIGEIQNGTNDNFVRIDGRCYKFDFNNNHQVNIFTKQKHKIKPKTRNLTIQVNGCIEDLPVAKAKITEFFKNIEKEDKFQFRPEFSSKMKPLIADSCARYSVKVSFQDSSVTFHGWEKAVGLVKEQCMKELLDLMYDHIKTTVKHPDEWEPDDNPFVMKKVRSTSQEFQKVLRRMHETMPNVTITKLERIQNQWLWEKYAQHRTRIHKKNQGKIEEKDLFHGTSDTDPSLIYDGEEGFDMRFCRRGGMWGLGNYFAVDASYSHRYAHHVWGEIYQMFFTRVITGESYWCDPDSSLRMPPEKHRDRNFSGERYDSVKGTTRGSQVFTIYDNLKAYPLYLITYDNYFF